MVNWNAYNCVHNCYEPLTFTFCDLYKSFCKNEAFKRHKGCSEINTVEQLYIHTNFNKYGKPTGMDCSLLTVSAYIKFKYEQADWKSKGKRQISGLIQKCYYLYYYFMKDCLCLDWPLTQTWEQPWALPHHNLQLWRLWVQALKKCFSTAHFLGYPQPQILVQ